VKKSQRPEERIVATLEKGDAGLSGWDMGRPLKARRAKSPNRLR
jgi:hypothetical protein